ncbi:MAG: NUDIX domain-containing protein [Anaerolineales bacterium]
MPALDNSSQSWPARRVICVGAVVLRENKALLIRQVKGASLEGQWSIPWGIVETEEFPSSAAVRETLEEGGVTAEIEGLLGIQNLSWENSIGIIYLCRHVAGEPLADGGVETDQAAYLSLDEIEELNEPIEPWCEWIVKRVLRNEHHLIPSEPNNPYQPKPAFL